MSKAQKPTKIKARSSFSVFEDYLQRNNYSPSTQVTYLRSIKRFTVWVKQERLALEQITYNDMLTYIKHLKKKGNARHTIAQEINSIKQFFKSLIEVEELVENPAAHIGLQSKRQEKLYRILSPDELELIYQELPRERATQKRNKVILGLLIYQGITTNELSKLRLEDLNLEHGKLTIKEGVKSNARTLKLEAHQILTLHDYIINTRGALLSKTNKITESLIVTTGTGSKIYNVLERLTKTLKHRYPELQSLRQIRASVITHWVKHYNLREAQYRAGHRYVSSTEKYRINDIESLEKNLSEYRPKLDLETL